MSWSIGKCSVCGLDVNHGESFVDTHATDSKEPWRERQSRWVPVDEDIHGWTPFEMTHPACFAREHGVDALVALVDESHRFLRRVYDR